MNVDELLQEMEAERLARKDKHHAWIQAKDAQAAQIPTIIDVFELLQKLMGDVAAIRAAQVPNSPSAS